MDGLTETATSQEAGSWLGRSMMRLVLKASGILLLVHLGSTFLFGHHEAIFGPQSSTLISQRRFVSAQYYLTNEGTRAAPRHRSHIGTVSIGTAIGKKWSLSATLPIEAVRGEHESATGVQDLVLGVRFFPDVGQDTWMTGVLTFEPPTGTLEHRALGAGGGFVYGTDWQGWSAMVYGLARTEASFEEAERRGDRLFIGGGLAYERNSLPFSPQLGLSWERTGRHREEGVVARESHTSALMLHPTVTKEFPNALQAFFIVSIPVAQGSGDGGWQRFRIGAGMVWGF